MEDGHIRIADAGRYRREILLGVEYLTLEPQSDKASIHPDEPCDIMRVKQFICTRVDQNTMILENRGVILRTFRPGRHPEPEVDQNPGISEDRERQTKWIVHRVSA